MSGRAVVLYSTKEIQAKILQLFRGPGRRDRRVALVAFLGSTSPGILPDPEGLEIVCAPNPIATSGDAVRWFLARGAQVRVSDRLHMKVYWSSTRGCVVCSANASQNTFGPAGSIEAGVYLPAGKVDIGRLIEKAKPRDIRPDDWRALDRAQHRPHALSVPGESAEAPVFDYSGWYASEPRRPWLLHSAVDGPYGPAAAVLAIVREHYGQQKATTYLSAAKGDLKAGDWVLSCWEYKGRLSGAEWVPVDFVVKTSPSDKGAHTRDAPFQAVQVRPNRTYGPPPFSLTLGFRRALRQAVAELGADWLDGLRSLRPPIGLLNRIEELIVAQS